MVLAPSDFPTVRALADIGADPLRRLGFDVDHQARDRGTMRQRLAKRDPVEAGGWSVFHIYWAGLDQLDPAVHQFLRGNGAAGSTGWPTSPRLEALRDEWLAAESDGDRARLARAIQARAFKDVPCARSARRSRLRRTARDWRACWAASRCSGTCAVFDPDSRARAWAGTMHHQPTERT